MDDQLIGKTIYHPGGPLTDQNQMLGRTSLYKEDGTPLEILSADESDARYGLCVDSVTYGGGLIDATAHIQSLIDAANANGGGIVIIPTGTFLILAGNLQMKSNVTLMGHGPGSVLKLGPSAANHLLRGNSQTRFRVTNLKLDGNDANQVSVRQALNVDNNDDMMIDHVWIVDSFGDGAQINSCRDSLVSDVIVRDAGRNGISVTSTAGTTSGLQFQNIHVDAKTGHSGLNGGIDIERGDDVQIRGLRVEGPFLYGVVVKGVSSSGCTRISLTDVHISSDVTTYGILLDGTAGTLSHIEVNGLVVQDASTLVNAVRVLEVVNDWVISNFVIGSSTGAGANAIFTGHTTTKPGPGIIGPGFVKGSWSSHGIAVRAPGTIVHGVRVSGVAGSGVQIVDANDVTVSGCRLTGNSRYGVETTGTSDRTVVVGNGLNGNTIGATTAVGAANVISSNAT